MASAITCAGGVADAVALRGERGLVYGVGTHGGTSDRLVYAAPYAGPAGRGYILLMISSFTRSIHCPTKSTDMRPSLGNSGRRKSRSTPASS